MPESQRLRSTSAQRFEQNGENCASDGLLQIGHGARRGVRGSDIGEM